MGAVVSKKHKMNQPQSEKCVAAGHETCVCAHCKQGPAYMLAQKRALHAEKCAALGFGPCCCYYCIGGEPISVGGKVALSQFQ